MAKCLRCGAGSEWIEGEARPPKTRDDGMLSSAPERALVDRLRVDVLWHQRRGNETIARDCQEAADEIERLHARLETRRTMMTDEQIQALTAYVRSAVRAAVAEAKDNAHWTADRLDDDEAKLIAALKDA